MTRRWHAAACLLGYMLLLTSLHAPAAYSSPGDPPAGSPAGSVYVLPLQQGRVDAAPKSAGTAAGGVGKTGGGRDASSEAAGGAVRDGAAGATEGEDSLYRSENNFGSSSEVPGANPSRTGGGDPEGGGRGAGAGSKAAIPGAAQIVGDAGNTSVPAAVVLLGAIGVLTAGIGLLARRYSR